MVNTEVRGRDAFGFYIYPRKVIFKKKGSVSDHIESDKRKDKRKKHHFFDRFVGQNMVLGHCRATTQGTENINHNNHPFETDNFVMAHNGMIRNDKYLKTSNNLDYSVETDSYIIIALIQKNYEKCGNVIKAIQDTTKEICGGYACWLLHKDTGKLYLFRYGGYPTYFGYIPKQETLVFASEPSFFSFMMDNVKEKHYLNKFSKKMFVYSTYEKRIYEEGETDSQKNISIYR